MHYVMTFSQGFDETKCKCKLNCWNITSCKAAMKPCVMPKALYNQIWFDVYMIEHHKNKKNKIKKSSVALYSNDTDTTMWTDLGLEYVIYLVSAVRYPSYYLYF